jgi:hypothetical protein
MLFGDGVYHNYGGLKISIYKKQKFFTLHPMTSFLPARPVHASVPAWDDCFEDHAIEGKANGWRILIDQETMTAQNRKGGRSTLEAEVMAKVSEANIPCRYLDCEWMGQRTKTGAGTLILIDTCEPLPYAERMKKLEHIEPVGFQIKSNALLRMNRLDHSMLKACWSEMEFVNNTAGEVVWEGFVMKKDDKYPWTKNTSHYSYEWKKMRIRS